MHSRSLTKPIHSHVNPFVTEALIFKVFMSQVPARIANGSTGALKTTIGLWPSTCNRPNHFRCANITTLNSIRILILICCKANITSCCCCCCCCHGRPAAMQAINSPALCCRLWPAVTKSLHINTNLANFKFHFDGDKSIHSFAAVSNAYINCWLRQGENAFN